MAPPHTHQTQFQITDKMTRDVNHTAGHREDKRSLNRKDDFKKIKIVRHLFPSIDRGPPTDMRSCAEWHEPQRSERRGSAYESQGLRDAL